MNVEMKAVYYSKTGPAEDVLKIDEFEIPELNNNSVLLKMIYSSVNPADTKKRSGWISQILDKDFIIPHSDGVGEIIEVGSKENKKYIGKKFWICGGSKDIQFGTCAEYFVSTLDHLVELPFGIDESVASCLGVPVATAYYSIFSSRHYVDFF